MLFTAHSLPEKVLERGDPYAARPSATAAAVALRAGLADWDFAYQSQGFTDDKWLGPTVESRIDQYAAEGVRELVLAPIGFVCDHVEILFDIDILSASTPPSAASRLRRPSPSTIPPLSRGPGRVARRSLRVVDHRRRHLRSLGRLLPGQGRHRFDLRRVARRAWAA